MPRSRTLPRERAVNTKDYLVTEKGIDASRISVATGTTDAQKVENYLVPSGASFAADVPGTTPVDETVVKPVVRKPLPVAAKPAAKKTGAKAAAKAAVAPVTKPVAKAAKKVAKKAKAATK